MTALHRQARLRWCRQHRQWSLNMWGNVMFSDESSARPQRAEVITDYLHNVGVERMERPAKSPDLNPIQHLWDQLGRAVRVRVTNTTTLADLQPILVEEWNAIPQQRVTRLVTSMRRRCQAVVAAYGSSTATEAPDGVLNE